MRDWGRAAEASEEKAYALSTPYKNLPLKGGGPAAARPWEPAQETRLAWARPGRARPRGRWRSAGGPALGAAGRAGEAAETPGPPPVPPAPSAGWPRGRLARARRGLWACAGGQQERRRWTTASQTGATRARQTPARRRGPAGERRAGPRRLALCPARGPQGHRGRPQQPGHRGGPVRGPPPGAPAQHPGRQRPTAPRPGRAPPAPARPRAAPALQAPPAAAFGRAQRRTGATGRRQPTRDAQATPGGPRR